MREALDAFKDFLADLVCVRIRASAAFANESVGRKLLLALGEWFEHCTIRNENFLPFFNVSKNAKMARECRDIEMNCSVGRATDLDPLKGGIHRRNR